MNKQIYMTWRYIEHKHVCNWGEICELLTWSGGKREQNRREISRSKDEERERMREIESEGERWAAERGFIDK